MIGLTAVVLAVALAAHALRDEIEKSLGWSAAVPAPVQSIDLGA